MKKALSIITVLSLIMSLTSCMGSTPAIQDEETLIEAKEEQTIKKVSEEKVSYEITDNRIKTWTNSIGTTWMQGIVEITNTGNTDLYLSSGKFEIDDSEGNIVAVKDLISVYPQVIAPGEKAYYYDETTLDSSADGQYTLIPTISAEKARVSRVRYETGSFTLSDKEYLGIQALGKITNTTEKEESMPLIVVFLFNSDNNLIGLMFTYGSKIAPGETTAENVSALSMPDDITSSSVDHFEVAAYPFQYQF